jgi:hypothetical protein
MTSLNPAPLVKKINKEICVHEKKKCCFCCDKNCKNKNNFFCYKCFYDYHISHVNKCLPIENFKAEPYQNYIRSYIKKIIDLIEKKINEIYTFLNNLENKKYKNIYELIKLNGLDLSFDLPLQINFYDRFFISVRKKCKEILKDSFSSILKQIINQGFKLNLCNENFDELKFFPNLKENEQKYKFKSSSEFILKGIGISSLKDKNISIEVKKGNYSILEEDFTLVNSKNYTTIIFNENIEIETYYEYLITIKGINDFSYLKDENFNQKGDIKFNSQIQNPILSYFLLEDNN